MQDFWWIFICYILFVCLAATNKSQKYSFITCTFKGNESQNSLLKLAKNFQLLAERKRHLWYRGMHFPPHQTSLDRLPLNQEHYS